MPCYVVVIVVLFQKLFLVLLACASAVAHFSHFVLLLFLSHVFPVL